MEFAEEEEGAVFAPLDQGHRGAAAETVSALVFTGAEDQVHVDSTERQASAESLGPDKATPTLLSGPG